MSTSLASYVLLFPLWFSLTQQAPITLNQLRIHGPTELSEQLAQILVDGYDQLTLAERSQLIYEIRRDHGPRAQQLLLGWLKQEQDPFVLSALLNSLGFTKLETIPEKAIRRFLTAGNAMVQNAAMRLYGRLPDADFAYLATLCQETTDPGFQIALLDAVAARRDTAFATFPAAILLQFANGVATPEVEAAALKAALSNPGKRDAEFIHWQSEAAASSNVILRCAATSDAHVNSFTPASTLARDSEPAVRMAVFQAYQDGASEELQKLLGLPADSDPAVRTARVELLGRLDVIPDIPVVRRILLEGFEDDWAQVRTAAETVLSGENMPRELALELATAALTTSADSARLIAYRQIIARQFSELLEAVRSRLPQETLSENIAAGLRVIIALKTPGDAADLDYLRPFIDHKSPLVRGAVAEALGKLQVPGSEPIIIQFATQDESENVQAYAFESMGFFPQRVFLPTIAERFQNRTGSADATRARAAACWAAARIQPATPEDLEAIDQIAYSIFYLCTQPTIPQGMGMIVFDDTDVICNGLVATTRLMKLYPDHEALIENGRKLLNIYKTPISEAVTASSAGLNVPVEEISTSVARQALQFLNDEECTQTALNIQGLAPILSWKEADN